MQNLPHSLPKLSDRFVHLLEVVVVRLYHSSQPSAQKLFKIVRLTFGVLFYMGDVDLDILLELRLFELVLLYEYLMRL